MARHSVCAAEKLQLYGTNGMTEMPPAVGSIENKYYSCTRSVFFCTRVYFSFHRCTRWKDRNEENHENCGLIRVSSLFDRNLASVARITDKYQVKFLSKASQQQHSCTLNTGRCSTTLGCTTTFTELLSGCALLPKIPVTNHEKTKQADGGSFLKHSQPVQGGHHDD